MEGTVSSEGSSGNILARQEARHIELPGDCKNQVNPKDAFLDRKISNCSLDDGPNSYVEIHNHQISEIKCANKKSTLCPHCKRTFGHNGALKNHVKSCLKRRYLKNSTKMPLAIVVPIQKEQVKGQTVKLEVKNIPEYPAEDIACSDTEKVEELLLPKVSNEEAGERYFKGTNMSRVCKGCDLIFKSPSHVRAHLQKKKLYCRRPPFICDKCGKICKNVHALVDHERSRVACRKWMILTHGSDVQFKFQDDNSKYIESLDFQENCSDNSKNNFNTLECVEDSLLSDPFNNSVIINDKLEAGFIKIEKLDPEVKIKEENDYGYETKTSSQPLVLAGSSKENCVEEDQSFSCQECKLNFLNSYRLRKHNFSTHRKFNPQSSRSKYTPNTSQASPKKNNSSMSPFKCEGGYRCPTCLLVFHYPSKLSTHLFRKVKCYPPNLVDPKCSPTSVARINVKRTFEELEEQSENELFGNHKPDSKIISNGKYSGTSLDEMSSDNSSSSVNTKQEFRSTIKSTINSKFKPNAFLIPKQKVLKKIVNKYRKLTHFNSGVVPFCEFCQLSFCNKSGLTKHYEKYHGGESPLVTEFSTKQVPCGCPFCDRSFLTLKARNTHVRCGHKDIPEEEVVTFLSDTLCEVCAKAFETVADLKDHFTKFHGQQFSDPTTSDEVPAVPALTCNNCKIQFTTKHHYSAHVNRYCPMLKERVKYIPSMSRHNIRQKSAILASSMKKRPKGGFCCTHCQTKFSYRTLYKAHMNRYCPMKNNVFTVNKIDSESSGSDMVCPFCQQVFVRKHLYDTHVKSVCPRRPSSSADTSLQKGIHVGRWFGKQYSCGGCRTIFKDRKILSQHQKMGCSGIVFEPRSGTASTNDQSKSGIKEWLGIGFSYVCRGCKNRFNSRKMLYYHQKTVCKRKLVSSNAPNETSSIYERSEKVSNESVSTGNSYVCRGCQSTFASRKTLYNHQKVVCKGFSQNSETLKLLQSPISTTISMAKASTLNGITYTCRGCLSRFQTRRDLYTHKISSCLSSDSKDGQKSLNCQKHVGFSCKLCAKRCISRKVLFIHQKFQCKFSKYKVPIPPIKPVAPPKSDSFLDQRFYQCKTCPDKLPSRKELFVHHKFHCIGRVPNLEAEIKVQSEAESISPTSESQESELPSPHNKYSCSQCKKKFHNRKVLFLHKKFNCPGSEIELKSPIKMDDVNTNVSCVKGYSCKRCCQTYADRKLLYIHKKFSCIGNGTTVRNVQKVTTKDNHLVTPKDLMTAEISEKLRMFPNQCPFCKRQYCNPFVRDRHIKLHTMVKSICCSFCPQTFARSEYLTRHMQNEHVEKLRFQCGKCGLKYARRINCIQHLNKFHKVVNKLELLIDLQSSNSQEDEIDSSPTDAQGEMPLKTKPAVPKLTLKRTSLVTRFKKKRAIWRPSVTPNFFRVVEDTPGRGIYSCDLCQMAKFSKMSTLHRHWRSRLHKENVARQRVGLLPLSTQLKEDFGNLICSVCRQSFPSIQDFVPHRLSHLNDPYEVSDLQPYSCEICSSVFTHHQRVQGHLMWHLRVNKSQCKDIGLRPVQTFFSNSLKVVAKKSISPIKDIKPLKTLQEQSNTPKEFISPVMSVPPQEPFECSMCSAQYASKSGVTTHMRRFCPKRFTCDKCKQCFSNSRVLAYHRGRSECVTNMKSSVLKCRHCSLELETTEDLGWHEKSCRKVHEAEKAGAFESSELSSLEEERYHCSSCKQAFSSITAACKHEEICLSTRSLGSSLSYHCLQCMVCNENFYSVRILEKHANVHCMERFYVRCLPCQKLFHNLKDLSEHISKLSSSMSIIEEDKVSEVASSQSDSTALPTRLKNLQEKSQSIRPLLSCQHCHKVFCDIYSLKVHMVVHTPFRCPVCNNEETTKQGFRIHKCRLADGSFATGAGPHKLSSRNQQTPFVSPSSSERVSGVISDSDVDFHEKKLLGSSVTLCKSNVQLGDPVKTSQTVLHLNKLRGDFSQLMFFLVADPELMTQLGWGQKPIDCVLQDVLVHLGEKPANDSDISNSKELVLELFRENIRRFLKLSVKEDVLETLLGTDNCAIDVVVSKMLGMCTDSGNEETSPK